MVTKLRPLVLLVPLLLGTSAVTTGSAEPGEGEAPTVAHADPSPTPVLPAPRVEPEVEAEAAPDEVGLDELDLSEVFWTVEFDESLGALASRWGLLPRDLVQLNSQLRGLDRVEAGMHLRVFEHDDATPTQSIGSPNKGRLRHGLPMPEGEYWTLRERRTRAYGADNAVRAMVTAFNRYGQSFDEAPPVSVGELSYRKGGRARPHRSHRTGRDVDLGYILTAGGDAKRWKRADESNFDAEKNWALIRALVETGEVQKIFISARLQRLLRPVAREQLSDEEFARYFRVRGQDSEHSPIIGHEDGHRDHMHVRFHCEAGNHRCRSRSHSARRHA